jgi:chromosome segregation ATPase
MPHHRNDKGADHGSGGKSHPKSRGSQESPEKDLARKVSKLQNLVAERDSLRAELDGLLLALATRRRGMENASELYQVMAGMDFRTIRGLSSSARQAQDRRNKRLKKKQTEEIDPAVQTYQQLNQATRLQGTVLTLPDSLDAFAEEEQGMVRSIAELQRSIERLDQQIERLQEELQYYPGEYLTLGYFGNDDEDDGGAEVGIFTTGEQLYPVSY